MVGTTDPKQTPKRRWRVVRMRGVQVHGAAAEQAIAGKLRAIASEIEKISDKEANCQRLMGVPGIGPRTADMLLRARREQYLKQYRDDYIAYDPGSAPLQHHFGEEWGERYLQEFLFGA